LILDKANLALNVTEKPKNPALFDEAYNNSNLEERAKWREAITESIRKLRNRSCLVIVYVTYLE
jgi:hypothetical protein